MNSTRKVGRGLALAGILFFVMATCKQGENSVTIEKKERDGKDQYLLITGISSLEDLKEMRGMLGADEPDAARLQVGLTAAAYFMSQVRGEGEDFAYDPTELRKAWEWAKATNSPIFFFLHGHSWGGGHTPGSWNYSPLFARLWSKSENRMLYNNGSAVEQLVLAGALELTWLSMSRLAQEVRRYRKRNLQQAVALILEFLNDPQYGHLVVGLSTDPEISYPVKFPPRKFPDYDLLGGYEEASLEEFRQFCRQHFPTIGALNAQFGTLFRSFEEIDPPRGQGSRPDLGQPQAEWDRFRPYRYRPSVEENMGSWSDFWLYFRFRQVENYVQDTVDWVGEVQAAAPARFRRIPPEKIYTHQYLASLGHDPYAAVSVASMFAKGAQPGISSLYGMRDFSGQRSDYEFTRYIWDMLYQIVNPQRKSDLNWGIMQFNPGSLTAAGEDPNVANVSFTKEQILDLLHLTFDVYHAKIVCPLVWKAPGSVYDIAGNRTLVEALREFNKRDRRER